MRKFSTGLASGIIGGLTAGIVLGVSAALADEKTRKRMTRNSKRAVRRAGHILEDFKEML